MFLVLSDLYNRGRTQTNSLLVDDEMDGTSHQQPILSLKDFILGFPTQRGEFALRLFVNLLIYC